MGFQNESQTWYGFCWVPKPLGRTHNPTQNQESKIFDPKPVVLGFGHKTQKNPSPMPIPGEGAEHDEDGALRGHPHVPTRKARQIDRAE